MSLFNGDITPNKVNMSYNINIAKKQCKVGSMIFIENKEVICSGSIIKKLYYFRIPSDPYRILDYSMILAIDEIDNNYSL